MNAPCLSCGRAPERHLNQGHLYQPDRRPEWVRRTIRRNVPLVASKELVGVR